MPEIPRVAVLDDYRRTAHRYAAWDFLPEGARLTCFSEHLGGPEEVIGALEPFDVVVAMRARTPFPAEMLAGLPYLRPYSQHERTTPHHPRTRTRTHTHTHTHTRKGTHHDHQ
ncbi:hypothetical protein SALBM135S_08518 [Streptomyces alboniger]